MENGKVWPYSRPTAAHKICLRAGISPTFVATCLHTRFPNIVFTVPDRTDHYVVIYQAVNECTLEAIFDAAEVLSIAWEVSQSDEV